MLYVWRGSDLNIRRPWEVKMFSRYKLSALFSISVLVTCLFGCGMSLQESLVGEWKGHLTEKTQSYMRKQAITFRFDAKGNAEVKLDDGNVERNRSRARPPQTITLLPQG